MSARPDLDLRKVTLNLYEADCTFLSTHLGHGWTEQVRTLVHAYVHGLSDQPQRKLTLEDLIDG